MKTSDVAQTEKAVIIEPHNKKGLANLLAVSMYILNQMLEDSYADVGEPTGTMYSQKQVQYMVNKYGIMKK